MKNRLSWIFSLLRKENLSAIVGSLRRRILKRDYLEMRLNLEEHQFTTSAQPNVGFPKFTSQLEVQCIRILNQVGSLGYWEKKRFESDIKRTVSNPSEQIFLISYDGQIVGMTVLHDCMPPLTCPEIGFVAVDPKFRGKNLGRFLFNYIFSSAKNRGLKEVFLRTDSFRIPAIRLYSQVGFRPYLRNNIDARRWRQIQFNWAIPLT